MSLDQFKLMEEHQKKLKEEALAAAYRIIKAAVLQDGEKTLNTETIEATREHFYAPCGCSCYRIILPGWAFREPIDIIDQIAAGCENCTDGHTTLGAKITKGGRPRTKQS